MTKRPYTPRAPAVPLICRCGVQFTRPAWRVRQAADQGATLHCSYACAHEARRTRTPESLAEYHRAYREKNRDLINQKQNAARQGEKRGHILERDRAIYRRNVETERRRAREYAAQHREEAMARRKAWPEKNPERNYFHITRNNLAQSMGLKPREIPSDLVEAKVEQLKIMRWVKERLANTPDRSGEADKTGTGLAEGESGLPEGSSKP